MRVFVAGSSRDLERAELAHFRLRRAGITVTSDWTSHVRAARNRGVMSDAELDDAERAEACASNRRCLAESTHFLLLAPSPDAPSRGAWVELGMALGSCVVVVAGLHARDCIYTHWAHRLYESDDVAIDSLIAETRR
jgi:hypothetical protein